MVDYKNNKNNNDKNLLIFPRFVRDTTENEVLIRSLVPNQRSSLRECRVNLSEMTPEEVVL